MNTHLRNKYRVIGQMSGTSLDGLDLVAVEFEFSDEKWKHKIIDAITISYSEIWEKKLRTAHLLSGSELLRLHNEFGKLLAGQINQFSKSFNPELIASHGHTIFHQPDKGLTFQLGNGFVIAAETGITTVADFRQPDVALGGQGAPLVPAGDRLLFDEYDYCLNIGGFANVSFERNRQRIAFDICPANIILNHFAAKCGLSFDKGGLLGRSGNINPDLLEKLNSLDFYKKEPPKSLGREWIESEFLPIIADFPGSDSDKFRTVYEHIAIQLAKSTNKPGKMLVTGGGAFNKFLIERFKELSVVNIVIPNSETINFKEALIFAFLGVLRIRNEINCLSSVTGAKRDHSTGIIFLP
jgi:anhydro-N-acetylmuramic acid kinase